MMKLDLTEAETSALFTALDVAVKTLGAQAVIPLAPLLTKLHAAAAEAAKEAGHGDDDILAGDRGADGDADGQPG